MATSQVNMRWDEDLLAKVDARCKLKGRTRADWVQAACEFVLEQIDTPTVVDRATLRMRIEPVQGNLNGPFRDEILDRESGRSERAQSYADKMRLGLIGPGYVDALKAEAEGIDPLTGEIIEPDLDT